MLLYYGIEVLWSLATFYMHLICIPLKPSSLFRLLKSAGDKPHSSSCWGWHLGIIIDSCPHSPYLSIRSPVVPLSALLSVACSCHLDDFGSEHTSQSTSLLFCLVSEMPPQPSESVHVWPTASVSPESLTAPMATLLLFPLWSQSLPSFLFTLFPVSFHFLLTELK